MSFRQITTIPAKISFNRIETFLIVAIVVCVCVRTKAGLPLRQSAAHRIIRANWMRTENTDKMNLACVQATAERLIYENVNWT